MSTVTSPEKPHVEEQREKAPVQIWWSNAIFFVTMHIITIIGIVYYRPWRSVSLGIKLLFFISWQLSSFGITFGYHRLWSHRALTAKRPLRIVLAWMGTMGFQGSIKWWVLRHRLHHRYVDDEEHDPYAATRGLLFSHMGWIFIKPKYARMQWIEQDDLNSDPVVAFQHKHYIPLALVSGIVVPTLIGTALGDTVAGFIWGACAVRLWVWHTTFFINSLAHWDGIQLYSEDMTARGNIILAMLTSGEGNHNFHHAFPHDYRAGYSNFDWDPTKWAIYVLHRYTSLITSIKRARDEDVEDAMEWVRTHGGSAHGFNFQEFEEWQAAQKKLKGKKKGSRKSSITKPAPPPEPEKLAPEVPQWTTKQLEDYISLTNELPQTFKKLILVIDGYVIDATKYASEHPGGSVMLRRFQYKPLSEKASQGSNDHVEVEKKTQDTGAKGDALQQALEKGDAHWAFHGGMNIHTRQAVKRMETLRIAKLVD